MELYDSMIIMQWHPVSPVQQSYHNIDPIASYGAARCCKWLSNGSAICANDLNDRRPWWKPSSWQNERHQSSVPFAWFDYLSYMTLCFRASWNRDVSTAPLAPLFTHSVTPHTHTVHSLASSALFALLTRCAVLTSLLVRSLLAPEIVGKCNIYSWIPQ